MNQFVDQSMQTQRLLRSNQQVQRYCIGKSNGWEMKAEAVQVSEESRPSELHTHDQANPIEELAFEMAFQGSLISGQQWCRKR